MEAELWWVLEYVEGDNGADVGEHHAQLCILGFDSSTACEDGGRVDAEGPIRGRASTAVEGLGGWWDRSFGAGSGCETVVVKGTLKHTMLSPSGGRTVTSLRGEMRPFLASVAVMFSVDFTSSHSRCNYQICKRHPNPIQFLWFLPIITPLILSTSLPTTSNTSRALARPSRRLALISWQNRSI